MPAKRTWREKLLDSKDFPKVFEARTSKRGGTGTIVIPAPLEVDALMRRVRRGKLTTINEIRTCLATRHGATMACPITTGIFSWIASHAAAEDEKAGKKKITPYWRTLKSTGDLNPKYPGGLTNQIKRLRAEGHKIQRKGKRTFVANFDQSLQRLGS